MQKPTSVAVLTSKGNRDGGRSGDGGQNRGQHERIKGGSIRLCSRQLFAVRLLCQALEIRQAKPSSCREGASGLTQRHLACEERRPGARENVSEASPAQLGLLCNSGGQREVGFAPVTPSPHTHKEVKLTGK